jgi:hypothetical protein
MGRQDRLHFDFGRPHIGIPCAGTESAASITADGGVHAPCLPIAPGLAQVIRSQDRHGRRRPLGEPVPNLDCVLRR